MKKNNTKNKVIQNRLQDLVEKINFHDALYYQQNTQKISNFEYDALRDELKELENKFPSLILDNSPSNKVGNTVSGEFKNIKHNSPMLSLNNGYMEEDVKKFFLKVSEKFNKVEILAETKVDGLSASIRYRNRKIIKAVTRGDGLQGEDITKNIFFVDGVETTLPKDFPEELEIRGEVFMPKEAFKKLNDSRLKEEKTTFSTARNAA